MGSECRMLFLFFTWMAGSMLMLFTELELSGGPGLMGKVLGEM